MSRPIRVPAAAALAAFAVVAASLLSGCGLQFPFRPGNAPAYPLPKLDPTGSKSLAQPLPQYGAGSVAYGAGTGSGAVLPPPAGTGLDPGPSALPMEPPAVTEAPLAVRPSVRTDPARPSRSAKSAKASKPAARAKVTASKASAPKAPSAAKAPATKAPTGKPGALKKGATKPAPPKSVAPSKSAAKVAPAKASGAKAAPQAKPSKPVAKTARPESPKKKAA